MLFHVKAGANQSNILSNILIKIFVYKNTEAQITQKLRRI